MRTSPLRIVLLSSPSGTADHPDRGGDSSRWSEAEFGRQVASEIKARTDHRRSDIPATTLTRDLPRVADETIFG